MGLFPKDWDLSESDKKLIKADNEIVCPVCFEIKAKNGVCGCDC